MSAYDQPGHPEAAQRRLTLSVPQAPWPLPTVKGDRDLLFLGAEFQAYVSPDGGASWTPLDAGLPVAQVREIMVQDREDDLT